MMKGKELNREREQKQFYHPCGGELMKHALFATVIKALFLKWQYATLYRAVLMIGKESFKPFENKVLWRILGLEGQEVTGG
jgi:hypothetical protein